MKKVTQEFYISAVSEQERPHVVAKAWEYIREQRDQLINGTDWTQMADSPLSDEKKAEFSAYRQELRNIPQSFDDPDAVVWPEKPTL